MMYQGAEGKESILHCHPCARATKWACTGTSSCKSPGGKIWAPPQSTPSKLCPYQQRTLEGVAPLPPRQPTAREWLWRRLPFWCEPCNDKPISSQAKRAVRRCDFLYTKLRENAINASAFRCINKTAPKKGRNEAEQLSSAGTLKCISDETDIL